MTAFSVFTDEYTTALLPINDGRPLALGNMFYRLGTGTIRCAGMRVYNPHDGSGAQNVTFTAHLSRTTTWGPTGPPSDDLIRQVGGITLLPHQWTTVTWAPFDLAPGVPIWLAYSCPNGDYAYATPDAMGAAAAVQATGGRPLFLAASTEIAPDTTKRDRAAYAYDAIDLRAPEGPGTYWAGIDLLADDGAPTPVTTNTETTWSVWDGGVEKPATVSLWDGTAEVPADGDIVA